MPWPWHRPDGLPDHWQASAARLVPWFEAMVPQEQARIGELADRLLTEKRWEAARGFSLTEEVRLTIALQASLLVLGLSFDHYAKVGSIIVHASSIVRDDERPTDVSGVWEDGPEELLGEAAHATGPIVLAWDEVRYAIRHPRRGADVVLHEFAHKLDMLDDVVDGTPPMGSQDELDRWIRVCTAEMEAIRARADDPDDDGRHLIWDYAGEDPGEFFAVVTEVFFLRPVQLRAHNPELYDCFATFYRQDPAAAA